MIPVSQKQIQEYTSKGWWGTKTILDVVFENVMATPDAEAIVDPYNRPALVGGEPKRLTYKQLAMYVDRLAIHFEKMGVKRDDVVLVQLPNIVDAVVAYFAAARIGAIPSPLATAARDR
ncbi:AMP-binding protein, partial [bacterium]|nr:AMP-binding protein [bacterium]